MEDSMLNKNPGYDDLARRYDFGRPVIERLAKLGVIVGGRTGGRGKWQSTADHVLYDVEGRQAPLVGAAKDSAKKQPLTTEVLKRELNLSTYTIRDMLKKGELPGWKLQIPSHHRKVAGKKVCERWYVDEDRFEDYRRKAMEKAMRRRFGISASDVDFHVCEVG
jgi:hypothetical protein